MIDREENFSQIHYTADAKYNIRTFIFDYINNFGKLAKNEFTKKAPFLYFTVLYLSGLAKVLDKVESSAGLAKTWLDFWGSSLIMGMFGMIWAYFIFGSLFHVGIKMAGGVSKIDTSRNIAVYAFLPLAIAIVVSYIYHTIFSGVVYFTNEYHATGMDAVLAILVIAATAYSIKKMYNGARAVPEVRRGPAIILFILLPSFMYFLLYFVMPFANN